jgi:hypothetical protein
MEMIGSIVLFCGDPLDSCDDQMYQRSVIVVVSRYTLDMAMDIWDTQCQGVGK